MSALGECGSFGCTLPAGHNRGKADIPANHSKEKAMLRPEFVRHASAEAIQAEIDLSARVIEREGARLAALQRLRAERLAQLADKTWPRAADSQSVPRP